MKRLIVSKHKGGSNLYIYENTKTGDIYTGDDEGIDDYDFIANSQTDDDYQFKVDAYVETWLDTHWDDDDFADYYGCSKDELEEVMEDD